ncbi:hypothetical protein AAIB41_02290 [Brucella sp. BE17]|uniref:hypothetical protein n=1 Tax=Brucella sp. BE17 TaxID=3142977 RepID=UPI0031BADD9D
MAPRKKTSRTPKRSTRRKSGSGSSAPVLTLAAILGLGAFSLWATSQHKSPQVAITALFDRIPSKAAPSTPKRTESRPAVTERVTPPKVQSKQDVAVTAPVPRPSAPVKPVIQKPVQKAAIDPVEPPLSTARRSTAQQPSLPPRGVNTAAHSPSVVHAKARLTIHKNAWDKSPGIGTVEKGREMRSYGKTGRWHRVIVPKTNMIGWVHEDQLIGGKSKPDSASLVTGSVVKKPQVVKRTSTQTHIKPPKAVGH